MSCQGTVTYVLVYTKLTAENAESAEKDKKWEGKKIDSCFRRNDIVRNYFATKERVCGVC